MTDRADPARLRARLEELAPKLPFEITIRPMMGGYIGYIGGRTFVSISTGGFGVKLLPAEQDRLLARPGATRMRHSPSEPASKTYITLPPKDLGNDERALEWLTIAADACGKGLLVAPLQTGFRPRNGWGD